MHILCGIEMLVFFCAIIREKEKFLPFPGGRVSDLPHPASDVNKARAVKAKAKYRRPRPKTNPES